MNYYVYEPKKTRPKSQWHAAHLYGTFPSRAAAQKWMDQKGMSIYPNVKIVQLTPESSFPGVRVIDINRSKPP